MIVNVCIDHRRTVKAFACAPRANGGGSTLTLAGLNVAFDADCCPSRDDDGATGFDPQRPLAAIAMDDPRCPLTARC